MPVTIIQVDAFTNKPFAGNPAAVCVLPAPREEEWMQAVASEMNLSETAFLHKEGEGYRLRWFTPILEIDLCGHATLASAHVLWERGSKPENEMIRFFTRSGELRAAKQGEWIELDFPAEPEEPIKAPVNLVEALGVKPLYVGKNRFDYLVEVDSEKTLRRLQPNFMALEKVHTRGVIVTSRSHSPEYDFVSRFFAPAAGIKEDPATGSAHCCLGPFWGKRFGKQELIGYQASARGGMVRVRLGEKRVYLGGQAVTVLRGELL
ncbi:MAG: PhzF family phenazine biosynthesis protein [bacterium]